MIAVVTYCLLPTQLRYVLISIGRAISSKIVARGLARCFNWNDSIFTFILATSLKYWKDVCATWPTTSRTTSTAMCADLCSKKTSFCFRSFFALISCCKYILDLFQYWCTSSYWLVFSPDLSEVFKAKILSAIFH